MWGVALRGVAQVLLFGSHIHSAHKNYPLYG
jgi:hypothetical protein